MLGPLVRRKHWICFLWIVRASCWALTRGVMVQSRAASLGVMFLGLPVVYAPWHYAERGAGFSPLMIGISPFSCTPQICQLASLGQALLFCINGLFRIGARFLTCAPCTLLTKNMSIVYCNGFAPLYSCQSVASTMPRFPMLPFSRVHQMF